VFAGVVDGLLAVRRRWATARIALSWGSPEPPTDALLDELRPELFNPWWPLVDADLIGACALAAARVHLDGGRAEQYGPTAGNGGRRDYHQPATRRRADTGLRTGATEGARVNMDELYFAEELALWAVDYIRSHTPTDVGTKAGPADFVTETDREVEEYVRKRIAEEFPDDAVVGEEFGASGPSDAARRWFVDPVDGTTNYAHGVPWASFSLGLVDAAGPIVGVVADPYREEVFSAARDAGARLGGVTDPVRRASRPGRRCAGHRIGRAPGLGRAAADDRSSCRGRMHVQDSRLVGNCRLPPWQPVGPTRSYSAATTPGCGGREC